MMKPRLVRNSTKIKVNSMGSQAVNGTSVIIFFDGSKAADVCGFMGVVSGATGDSP